MDEAPLSDKAIFEDAVTKAAALAAGGLDYLRAVKEIARLYSLTKAEVGRIVKKKRAELDAEAAAKAKAEKGDDQPIILFDRRDDFEEMNTKLAVLREPVGSILYEDGVNGFQVASKGELDVIFANKPNAPRDGWVKAWLEYEHRREYSRIVFKPGIDAGDAYNLWTTWGVDPADNGVDIMPFWRFVKRTICAGDVKRYRYIRKWMAHAVQRPAEMPRVALLLHSGEGTGKNTLVRWFSPIFGRQHFFMATSLQGVTGHFNIHLANALLVFANEAVWGGDKREHGRLKALITDETSDVTAKRQDTLMVDNFKRWIFASNADHPVPVDRSDRRFAVFEVNPDKVGDADYFVKLEALRTNGGMEALMFDLLNEDIADFNAERDRPRSGLAIYKTQSMSPLEQWLSSTLEKGEIRRYNQRHDCYEPWDGYVLKNLLYDSYRESMKSAKSAAECESTFWVRLRAIGVLARRDRRAPKTQSGERPRAAALHDLHDARQAFAKHMGETVESLWDELSDMPGPCSACADEILAEGRSRY
jgi:hypothetical protein